MAESREQAIFKGIGLAIAYAALYYGLRYISFNQWFLPAGLRAACLLFLPYRYWPFVFLGEAGLTLSQKLGMADEYGYSWAIFSSILLAPLTSLALLAVREKNPRIETITKWLPLVTLPVAIWTSISKIALNYVFSGPVKLVTYENFTHYVIGDFLGILLIVLCKLLLTRENWRIVRPSQMTPFALASFLFIVGVFCILKLLPDAQDLARGSLMLLMTTPIVYLTFRHGWHGAAIGVVMVNLGIALTLEYTGLKGQHDNTAFFAQIGSAFASIAFLLLGSRLTAQQDEARQSAIAEQEAWDVTRLQMHASDPTVRDQLIAMASMLATMERARHKLAKQMTENGLHQESLDLNTEGVIHRQIFDEIAVALYPIEIEIHGLYWVVSKPSFRESKASGLNIDTRFGAIDPRTLSLHLQLLSYRCLCNAIDLLSDWEPESYRMVFRVWHGSERRGIYLSIAITAIDSLQRTPYGENAIRLLQILVRMHDGILHQEPTHISILLSEPNVVSPAQIDSRATA